VSDVNIVNVIEMRNIVSVDEIQPNLITVTTFSTESVQNTWTSRSGAPWTIEIDIEI
jgi:hypothetical protein